MPSVDYSITLSPSHSCVPRLMDFIEDRKELPLPKRQELVGLMLHLDSMSIRHIHVAVRQGIWYIEFIVNEKRKFNGEAKCFAKALDATLRSVHHLDLN